MTSDDLKARLARERAKVECPICRHRQWLASERGRCDQCGSEIALFDDRAAAEDELERVVKGGRVSFLRELPDGLFAVIANRAFPAKGGS